MWPVMINRGEIVWLGIASGVIGGMTGGIMLAIGLVMIDGGAHVGILWMLLSMPASSIFGWLMARRLARQLT
jgi:hypothetical protein